MNLLNTLDILFITYDKAITPVKILALIENKVRADMELEADSVNRIV